VSNYPENIQNIMELSHRVARVADRIDTSCDRAIPPSTNEEGDPFGIEEALRDFIRALKALSPGELYLLLATVVALQGHGDLRKLLTLYGALTECFPQPHQAAYYLYRHARFVGVLLESAREVFEQYGINVHRLFTPIRPELN
jgi:hypothetical protein